MRLSDYRCEAGDYRTQRHHIIEGGARCWQLRDEFEDIISEYPTLRDALKMALLYER